MVPDTRRRPLENMPASLFFGSAGGALTVTWVGGGGGGIVAAVSLGTDTGALTPAPVVSGCVWAAAIGIARHAVHVNATRGVDIRA